MKKTIICFVMLALLAAHIFALPASAENMTAYTYTVSPDDRWTRTQSAYLTGEILFGDAELNSAEDIFVKNSTLYVADTKNSRVLMYDLNTKEIREIGTDFLSMPCGLFVGDNLNIYVADSGKNVIFLMDNQGNLLKEYGRPTQATFGKDTQYSPRKLTADSMGIMNIVSEGSYDGMIQLNADGEFLGYFGYNNVPMSPLEMLQDAIFTESQKEKLFNKIPLTFKNIDADVQGMVYTVTGEVNGNAIKKHNISGLNLLSEKMKDETNFADLAVGKYGQIIAVTETGLVFEYDRTGRLVFSFGGRAISSEKSGLFTFVSAVAVDDNDCLYVLDRERGLVHTFVPTEFANLLHTAMDDYNNGEYAKSLSGWRSLQKQTGNTKIVMGGMADNYLRLENYNKAADYYYKANEPSGYSDAWWELRNRSVRAFLPAVCISIFLIIVLLKIFSHLRKKKGTAEHIPLLKRAEQTPRLHFLYLCHSAVFRPADAFYAVRREGKGGILSASLLYVSGLLVFCVDFLFRGFIFNRNAVSDISFALAAVMFLLPVALFICCSYMVSEINNGEGRFRDMYIAGAYALTPLIVFLPIITLLTHILTQNEYFLIDFSTTLVYVWAVVLMLIALKQIHNYTVSQVLKNVVLSLFLMLIILLAASMLGMYWNQIGDILSSIGNEVRYRVS